MNINFVKKNIKKLIEKQGLNLKSLAEKIDLSYENFYGIWKNSNVELLTLDLIEKISKALNCKIIEIIGFKSISDYEKFCEEKQAFLPGYLLKIIEYCLIADMYKPISDVAVYLKKQQLNDFESLKEQNNTEKLDLLFQQWQLDFFEFFGFSFVDIVVGIVSQEPFLLKKLGKDISQKNNIEKYKEILKRIDDNNIILNSKIIIKIWEACEKFKINNLNLEYLFRNLSEIKTEDNFMYLFYGEEYIKLLEELDKIYLPRNKVFSSFEKMCYSMPDGLYNTPQKILKLWNFYLKTLLEQGYGVLTSYAPPDETEQQIIIHKLSKLQNFI